MKTEKLIQKCCKGNARAQKFLYEKYVGLLFSTANRYIKNKNDTEDILLQSFLKIFTKLSGFQFFNEVAFIAWMKKIVINEILMQQRKEGNMIYLFEADFGIENKEITMPDIFEEKEILESINQLPDGYKTVFLLYVVEGYSHKEIGELLDIAETTSRSQFFKARKLLQKQLSKTYEIKLGN